MRRYAAEICSVEREWRTEAPEEQEAVLRLDEWGWKAAIGENRTTVPYMTAAQALEAVIGGPLPMWAFQFACEASSAGEKLPSPGASRFSST